MSLIINHLWKIPIVKCQIHPVAERLSGGQSAYMSETPQQKLLLPGSAQYVTWGGSRNNYQNKLCVQTFPQPHGGGGTGGEQRALEDKRGNWLVRRQLWSSQLYGSKRTASTAQPCCTAHKTIPPSAQKWLIRPKTNVHTTPIFPASLSLVNHTFI